MTLKTILKNFLNYADTLEAQKKLGKDIYEVDFQKLKALTEELKHDKDYSTSEGLKEVNRRKNRYKDILPYDYTRVILSEYPGVPGSDYINANYIKGASGSLAYIASQGPLPNTVVDFWRMIWECEVQVIVMACNEQESGKYKCECYWPTDEEKKQYGNINVEFVKWRQVCPDFLVRTLKACWENEERVICQFHYTTWPDHGVPNSVQPILELVRLIRDCQASEAVPVLVHCSAGCGRTGTICAIDYVWGLMRMGKLTKNFNLYNVIADMRRQRIAMVQTKEQYVLVHKAVSSLFEQQLRVIDSHTYENLDEDGEPLILKELHQQEEDIYEDILEPPLADESFSTSEKKPNERKVLPSNAFLEFNANKDVPPIPSKRDPFPENLLNFTKTIVYKSENDRCPSETLQKSNISDGHKDNMELVKNVKEVDNEYDIPYSRNSQILIKLCREESVKRLISGWNKAVEQSDDLKSKEIYPENEVYAKSNISKNLEQVFPDQKTKSNHEKYDVPTDQTIEYSDLNSLSKTDNRTDDSTDIYSKSSSPEDTHAGKLVGKATVIRRPSIAKLKALFEKSSQNNTDSNDTGRRRALFRSHSHYVSHTSRAFSLSENANQMNISSSDAKSHVPKSEEIRHEKEKSNQRNTEANVLYNVENSGSVNTNFQNFNIHENIRYFQQCDENKKQPKDPQMSSSNFSRRNSQEILDDFSNIPNTFETRYNSVDSNTGIKFHNKQNSDFDSKKDMPPELPVKKKPAIPLPQSSNLGEKSSKELEPTVPRFKVNLPKENQTESSIRNNNISVHKESISNKNNHTDKVFKDVNKASVASPDWNSDDSLREYVRRSQDVERHVLRKNQSFSDPEQSARCLEQTSKQAVKPKLSLTDQTYPKLTYSAEKGLDEKSSFSYESAYMNVNSLAQKNIRQIEEKLKSHPRGAIIDLTSRKSYIDEMATQNDRPYVFRNTIETVKFLPKQEARELSSQEKHVKTEQTAKDFSSKNHDTISKSNTAKSDASKNESDINSKNLLLHSPPPKSKRGHLSKSNSKSPATSSTQTSTERSLLDNQKTSVNTTTSTAVATSTEKIKQNPKAVVIPNSSSSNVPQNVNTINSTPAADRSDPRYFPVMRQTASDAKYESEKHKAETREGASGRQTSSYEPLYSGKPINSIYQKLSHCYEKPAQEIGVLKDSKYNHDKTHYEKESLYGLQRSTSGPQILPSDTTQINSHSSDLNRSYNIYGQVKEDPKLSKSFHGTESHSTTHYDKSHMYGIYGTTGQHNAFPPGPPKPPRTYHYDVKNSQEKLPDSNYKSDHNVKRDGGRYIVSVASPKHSATQNSLQSTNNVNDYRYDRVGDVGHANKNTYQAPSNYASPPMSNEVHMSRSYPLTNYDRSYFPRPYGKQYYPESIAFRNVQPVHHVTNNIYGTVGEKPSYPQQNIYGTIKHRNTFADYENVYDAQVDYMHAMSNSNPKSEHQNIYQSVNASGLQYSQPDAIYGVLHSQKPHSQYVKSSQVSAQRDFTNLGDSSGNSVPKRVYFDTLQRRNKQHVTWEQRRSHDDMDIRPAPSARLREQIHARRSMVELDNLEISVASDEDCSEKNNTADALLSPTTSLSKISAMKNDRLCDTSQSKTGESNDFPKDLHKKYTSVHSKEQASFGETLSKAFGKLTSFTKFNAKEVPSVSVAPVDNNASSKGSKQKDKERPHNFSLQSPNSKELPLEQWTQV